MRAVLRAANASTTTSKLALFPDWTLQWDFLCTTYQHARLSSRVPRPTLGAGGRDVLLFVCMCTCMRNHALELLRTSDRAAFLDSCSESATITPPPIIWSVRARVWVCAGDRDRGRDRDGEIAEFACSSRARALSDDGAGMHSASLRVPRHHRVRRSRSAIRAAAYCLTTTSHFTAGRLSARFSSRPHVETLPGANQLLARAPAHQTVHKRLHPSSSHAPSLTASQCSRQCHVASRPPTTDYCSTAHKMLSPSTPAALCS